ncbi:chemotaxis protein CheW [Geomonas sp. Red276]
MPLDQEESYDIQTVLAKMRDEYWHGLAEQETGAEELMDCLVFTLGGERHAFETRHACEVIRVPRLVKVPAVQDLIKGVFNLRGEITAAMDVRPLLGLPQPELGPTGRIIVVKSEQFATGILAEAALGVQGLPLEQFEPSHPGSSLDRRRLVRGHFNTDDGATILLDLEALLASPEIMVGAD